MCHKHIININLSIANDKILTKIQNEPNSSRTLYSEYAHTPYAPQTLQISSLSNAMVI